MSSSKRRHVKPILQLLANFEFIILSIVSVLFTPFFFLTAALDTALLPRFLALAAIVLLFSIGLFGKSRKTPAPFDFSVLRRKVFLAIMLYLLVAALAFVPALNAGESLAELLKIFLAAAFFAIATLLFGASPNAIVILTRTVTMTATAAAIIGICQYFFIAFNSIPGNFLVYGTMANKNLFASFIFICLPFTAYGFLQFAGFWRIMSAGALALISFCLVITQTRAVWVAIAAATLLVIIFLIIFIKRLQLAPEQIVFLRCRLVQTALLAAVMVSAAGFSHSRQTATNYKVQRTFERPRSSVDERLLLWRKSLEMIKEHPLLGVGVGHWKIWLPHYGVSGMRSEMGFIHFQRPHNDFIWVWAESGPLGLAIYLSIFLIVFFYIYKIWRQASALDAKIFSLLMFFGIAGYLVIACFDFPKERIEHTILLMLMLAAVTSIYHQTHPLSNTTISASALLSLFLFSGILSLSAIAVGWLRLNSEIHTKKALAAREAGDWPAVIAELDQGNSPLAAMDPMATPLSWYRGAANFSLNRIDEAFEDFQQAYAIHPYHLHVLNNLATCYELKGDHEQAIAYYNQALAISPRFEEVLINLSVVYYYQKKYAQARQTLLRCDSTSANPKIPAYMQAITAQLTKRDSLK